MGIIENILAVIVVLGVLITFHEYGHFWVARRCGVKVLRFSIGFGKPFLIRKDRHGTEFALAYIPLGGYVRMLDEREGPVAEHELHRAFNRKNVYQRIAIVAAGPIANFLLAFLLYWALFIHGVTGVVPVVGQITPDSPAASAGLKSGEEITRIDGRDVRSWEDVNLSLVGMIGRDGNIDIATSEGRSYHLSVQQYMVHQDPPQPLETLGFVPWQPQIKARLGHVVEGSPAAQAGLATGDEIVSVDGKPVTDWVALVGIIRSSADRTLVLTVRHADGSQETISLTPQSRKLDSGKVVGYIGAAAQAQPFPQRYLRDIRYSPLAAMSQALNKTAEMTWLTLDSVRKMIVGLISPRNLSGPVTIARVAGDSARSGIETFLGFLAYLSISLGVLNLMPIPVLDGGHLLYFFVEAIRGRALSERIQLTGLKVGVTLVGAIMIMALYFDLLRL